MDQLETLLPVTGARASAAGVRTPNRWLILATMTGALSMVMIDQTVVSVALPTMQRDLGRSTTGVQWVVNAYLLPLAVLVAFGGRVADLLGAEWTFRAGAGPLRALRWRRHQAVRTRAGVRRRPSTGSRLRPVPSHRRGGDHHEDAGRAGEVQDERGGRRIEEVRVVGAEADGPSVRAPADALGAAADELERRVGAHVIGNERGEGPQWDRARTGRAPCPVGELAPLVGRVDASRASRDRPTPVAALMTTRHRADRRARWRSVEARARVNGRYSATATIRAGLKPTNYAVMGTFQGKGLDNVAWITVR